MTAANQEQTGAVSWPPMSEAPRDGTPIKAWNSVDREWCVVHWWTCYDADGRAYSSWAELADDGAVFRDGVFTHWLPYAVN